MSKKPQLVVQKASPNGNIFYIIQKCALLTGMKSEDILKEVQLCDSYESALKVIRKYVDLVEI